MHVRIRLLVVKSLMGCAGSRMIRSVGGGTGIKDQKLQVISVHCRCKLTYFQLEVDGLLVLLTVGY